MEEVAAEPTETLQENRIQVSNTKKPLFFYVNLAKGLGKWRVEGVPREERERFGRMVLSSHERFLQQHDEVELSALGLAIATVVTVAEILKNNGLVVLKRIHTCTVEQHNEEKDHAVQKAKMQIVLVKSDRFDELNTMGINHIEQCEV